MKKTAALLLALTLTAAFFFVSGSPAAVSPQDNISPSPTVATPPEGAIIVPDNYPTIQEAIDNATTGDTVFVRNGTYNYNVFGNVSKDGITIDKSISLIGENSQNTFIMPFAILHTQRVYLNSAIQITAPNVIISGFTLDGRVNLKFQQAPGEHVDFSGISEPYIGHQVMTGFLVSADAAGCKLIDNNLNRFSTDGITARGENATISKNNVFAAGYTGISVIGNNSIISENIIQNCSTGISCGSNSFVSKNYVANNKIVGVNIASASPYSGHYINNYFHARNVTVTQNEIIGTNYYQQGGCGLAIGGDGPSYVYQNNITDNFDFGIVFQGSNNASIYNNNILRNRIGINLINIWLPSNSTSVGLGNKVYYNNIIDNVQNVYVEHGYIYYDYSTIPRYNVTVPYNGTDIVKWDNGYVGNFWSDYQSKYPDASEIDSSGIGNATYFMDENNTDHFPLLSQVDIQAPAPTPTPIPNRASAVLPTIAAVVVVLAVAIGVGVLVYFKKYRNHELIQNEKR